MSTNTQHTAALDITDPLVRAAVARHVADVVRYLYPDDLADAMQLDGWNAVRDIADTVLARIHVGERTAQNGKDQ